MNYKIILIAVFATISMFSLVIFGVTRFTSPMQSEISVNAAKKADQSVYATVKEEFVGQPHSDFDKPSSIETFAESPYKSNATVSTATVLNQISAPAIENKTAAIQDDEVFDGRKIIKTEAEWRKLLTKKEFYVLREKGTEEPFTGKYTDNKQQGTYHCRACGLALFSSKSKFDSKTGWASFFKPIDAVNITEVTDKSLEEARTEVLCHRCNSHLGHVFDDGPEPTGLRYCINSVSLKFKKRQ